jgi:GntR family transcriptional regulator
LIGASPIKLPALTLCHMAREVPAKYQQLADDLRARIRSGEYEPGSQLPSKAALMGKHHVALGTVNEALRVLRGEGLLETRQGTGTYVCDPLPDEGAPSEYETMMERLDGMTDEVRRLRERLDAVERELAQRRPAD